MYFIIKVAGHGGIVNNYPKIKQNFKVYVIMVEHTLKNIIITRYLIINGRLFTTE